MSEMQFIAVVRVRIRPLIPRLPLVAGVSVSVLGTPVVDGAAYVKVPFLPKLDMGSLPGRRAHSLFTHTHTHTHTHARETFSPRST